MDVAAASSPGPMRLRDLNLSSSPYARRTASTSSPYARRTASKSPMPERADEDPLSSTQLWHSKNTLQSDVPDSLAQYALLTARPHEFGQGNPLKPLYYSGYRVCAADCDPHAV